MIFGAQIGLLIYGITAILRKFRGNSGDREIQQGNSGDIHDKYCQAKNNNIPWPFLKNLRWRIDQLTFYCCVALPGGLHSIFMCVWGHVLIILFAHHFNRAANFHTLNHPGFPLSFKARFNSSVMSLGTIPLGI